MWSEKSVLRQIFGLLERFFSRAAIWLLFSLFFSFFFARIFWKGDNCGVKFVSNIHICSFSAHQKAKVGCVYWGNCFWIWLRKCNLNYSRGQFLKRLRSAEQKKEFKFKEPVGLLEILYSSEFQKDEDIFRIGSLCPYMKLYTVLSISTLQLITALWLKTYYILCWKQWMSCNFFYKNRR